MLYFKKKTLRRDKNKTSKVVNINFLQSSKKLYCSSSGILYAGKLNYIYFKIFSTIEMKLNLNYLKGN